MERSQVLEASRQRRASGTTGELKLYGMRAAYDEIIAVVPQARLRRDREAPARTAAGDHLGSGQGLVAFLGRSEGTVQLGLQPIKRVALRAL